MRALWILTAALAASACAPVPRLPPAGPDRAAAAQPPAAPQRNVTGFADALRCMDNLYIAYGTRDVSVLLEDLTDATQKVSAGTRDMMISAISDMNRRSRAIQVIAFGQDANNLVAFLASAQNRSPFAVVPQFGLRGSISQLDESVLRRQSDVGGSLGGLFGAGASRSRQLNVLGLDLAMVTTRDLAVVPGAVSKNQTTLLREGNALDSQATISKVGINFSTSFQRTDGTAQALRNMVELASVELFGRLLKLPYWSCIGADADNPEVRAEIEDWFIGMERAGELTPYFQLQLRNRGFYDGPVDGAVTPALRQAVAAYRLAVGLGDTPVVDLALFTRFIGGPFPPPPAQPFADAGAPSTATAAVATPVAPAGVAPVPTAPAAPTSRITLALEPLKAAYQPGEPFGVRVRPNVPAYVYCYARDPQGVVQRIFPSRFAPDPLVRPDRPLELPGAQRFTLPAADTLEVACLAAPREVYNDVPAALRWGDFQALNAVRGFEEVRRMLEGLARESVPLATLKAPMAR